MSQSLKRILVPLDGSRLAESALPMAVKLAEALGADVLLLHIIEEHAPQTVHGEPHLTTTREAETYLAGIAQQYEGRARFEQHVHGTEEQHVAASIAAHVVEHDAGMVALCTHGRSGLRRVVSGSIAQQVLRRVDVPVLLVRPKMEVRDKLEAILVPLDGTPRAESALGIASEIARATGTEIFLVHVVPTIETVTGDLQAAARLTPLSTAEALEVEREQSMDYMETTAEQLRTQGVRATVLLRRGNTAPTLAEAARQSDAGLVVIATHARAGLDAIWTGSIAATLVERVTVPVVMVKIAPPK